MKEIGEEAGAPPPGNGDGEPDEEAKEQARAFKAAWEAMLVEGMNGKEGEDPVLSLGEALGDRKENPGSSSAGAGSSTENFQDKIRQAMEKMKEAEGMNKASGSGEGNPESMEELLKTLGDLGLGDLGSDPTGGDDTELAGFLESMMGQLMSKDILYEPLKELADGVSCV